MTQPNAEYLGLIEADAIAKKDQLLRIFGNLPQEVLTQIEANGSGLTFLQHFLARRIQSAGNHNNIAELIASAQGNYIPDKTELPRIHESIELFKKIPTLHYSGLTPQELEDSTISPHKIASAGVIISGPKTSYNIAFKFQEQVVELSGTIDSSKIEHIANTVVTALGYQSRATTSIPIHNNKESIIITTKAQKIITVAKAIAEYLSAESNLVSQIQLVYRGVSNTEFENSGLPFTLAR